MTRLTFSGHVEAGDAYRHKLDEDHGAILIGGQDVVAMIGEAHFTGPVTVAIADARFTAESLRADLGWGYSEYTPMDKDELRAGDVDLLSVLDRYAGQTITMWVADGPIDLSA